MEIEQAYISFLARYQKAYTSNGKTLISKFKIFKDNYMMVKEHNEKHATGSKYAFEMEINQYADMTD